jgi:hypothetical protein
MVDGDRALVAVGAEVEAGLGATGFVAARVSEERRSVLASIITGSGPLDLDHVGTQIAEELSGEGRGEDPAQVEHSDAVERAAHEGPDLFGSRGMPRTRSLMMFFWTSLVPA